MAVRAGACFIKPPVRIHIHYEEQGLACGLYLSRHSKERGTGDQVSTPIHVQAAVVIHCRAADGGESGSMLHQTS